MKLQKQLRAYAKQIQDLTGECLHGEGGHKAGWGGGAGCFGAGASPGLKVWGPGHPQTPGSSSWAEPKGPAPGPPAQGTAGCDPCSSPPVKRETTGLGQEPAASQAAPSPPGLSQAMLAWRMEDEGRIIKAVITGRVWADGDPITQRSSLLPTRVFSPEDGLIPPTSQGQHPAPFSSR